MLLVEAPVGREVGEECEDVGVRFGSFWVGGCGHGGGGGRGRDGVRSLADPGFHSLGMALDCLCARC